MLAPVIVGVLTSVAAFAPLLVTGGTFGDITRAIPLVVISVLLISLLEAFCILPSHLSQGGAWSRGLIKRIQGGIAGALATVRDRVVQPGVAFAARWRYATVGLATAFFILCMSLLANGQVRFIFFPQIEGNNISPTLTMPEGTPFERTDAAIRRMAAAAEQVAHGAGRQDTGHTGEFKQRQCHAGQPEVTGFQVDIGRQKCGHGGVHKPARNQDRRQGPKDVAQLTPCLQRR